MTVIDVHTHMMSNAYLDKVLRLNPEKYVKSRDAQGREAIFKDGAPFLTPTPPMFDYEKRIADMQSVGIDLSVVSLTCPNVYWGGENVSAETAIEMNDDMASAQRRFPHQIRYFASLPWQYPSAAVAELHRAVDNGAIGVMVLANISDVPLTDEHFAPVWDAIDKLSLPVLIHPSTPPGLAELDLDKFNMVWSIGFPMDTTMAVARMMLSGFFDTYQNLKIIASHGAGAIPLLLSRLDHGWDVFPSLKRTMTKRPYDYVGQIYADSVVYTEAALNFTIDVLGAENVLFGTDYPHTVSVPRESLALSQTLPDETMQLVQSGNAVRLFEL